MKSSNVSSDDISDTLQQTTPSQLLAPSATKRKFHEQISMYGKENIIANAPIPVTKTPNKQVEEKKRKVLSQSFCSDFNSTPPSASIRRSTKYVGGIMSSIKKKGGKLIRTLTPPRHVNVGVKTPLRRKNFVNNHQFDHSDANNSLSSDNTFYKENLSSKHKLTLSSKFDNAHQFELRTCESDPSPFQLEIPSHENILVHCKICCIMENYFDIGGIDFDFSNLMPWKINNQYSTNAQTGAIDHLSGKSISENQGVANSDKVKDVLSSLEDIVDDIVVEGFFREYYENDGREGGLGRVEACVLSSNKLRRFIICYRCSSDVQDCPVLGIQQTRRNESNENHKVKQYEKVPTKKDHGLKRGEQKAINVDVNQSFLQPFNLSNIQENMSTLLDRLTTLKPFFDVTVTGHSFGGALATLASQSYAACYPATRVYCHVFGSPIVGGSTFRREVHSLPNLNLIRVERSTDPFVNLPQKNGNSQVSNQNHTDIDWVHVGHSLRLTPANTFGVSEEAKRPVDVHVYRYDKHRPSSNFLKAKLLSVNNLTKLKIGNEIMSYRKDLEKINTLNLKWVNSFEGEAINNEISTNGIFA